MRYLLVALSFVAGVVATGLVLNVSRSNAQSGDGLITEFTAANIKRAITDAGGQYLETATGSHGYETVRFRYEGRNYHAGISACTKDKVACKGIELVAGFGTKNVTIPLEAVNTYNYNHADGKAIFVASNPSLDTARYLFAVGGITHENVVFEIKNFHTRTNDLLEHLRKASVIASNAAPSGPAVAPLSAPTPGDAPSQAHIVHEPGNALPR